MVPTCSLKKSLVGPGILTIINSFFSTSPIPSSLTHVMVQILVKKKTKTNWPWKIQITQLQIRPAVSLWKKRFSQVSSQHTAQYKLFWKTCSTQETVPSPSSLSTCSLWCQWNLLSIYLYLNLESFSVVVWHLFTFYSHTMTNTLIYRRSWLTAHLGHVWASVL